MGRIEIKETALHPRGFVKCPLEPKRKPVILLWGWFLLPVEADSSKAGRKVVPVFHQSPLP